MELTPTGRMQGLENGFQSESPDTWLTNGNPWEIPRRDLAYKIGFYGSVQNGKWVPDEQVRINWLLLILISGAICVLLSSSLIQSHSGLSL